jgi:hypothetical protein
MSQLVLAHILSESQLRQYAKLVAADDDLPFPNEASELQSFFEFDATPMVCLEVMLEEVFEGSASERTLFPGQIQSGQVQAIRQEQVPLLFAFHHSDRVRIDLALEQLAAHPDQLGAFYEEFYEEEWDDASRAMLEACRFLQGGLERLTLEDCWLLVFVS